MFGEKPLRGDSSILAQGETRREAQPCGETSALDREPRSRLRLVSDAGPEAAPASLRKVAQESVSHLAFKPRKANEDIPILLRSSAQRRGAVRLAAAIDALIVSRDRKIRRCIIRDLSTAGAQLECEEANLLAGEMVLAVPLAHIAITCEVAWRRGNRAGVQFCRGRMTPAQIEELLSL
ncbi:PilZ domain-containing protein [Afifella pfennigii]|uniref:PilZ domain-containing protein n=1 Tax=Afifella pfennigii TaxID=209897 RepID=UPI000554E9CC|nr:PilZ domain-containing protein [Afifella pfennigii]